MGSMLWKHIVRRGPRWWSWLPWPGVHRAAPVPRSRAGWMHRGKMWWCESRAEEAATECCFKMPLISQGLAHQLGEFENGWAVIARFLGMFLFLLIIKERASKVCVCSCQLIRMCLSHWNWSASMRTIRNWSFYLYWKEFSFVTYTFLTEVVVYNFHNFKVICSKCNSA